MPGKVENATALLAQSNGGRGGLGAGSANLTIDGGVQTDTRAATGHAHGALAHSFGGAGQNGGDPGKVTVATGEISRVRTAGPSSIGATAQSGGVRGGKGGSTAGGAVVAPDAPLTDAFGKVLNSCQKT